MDFVRYYYEMQYWIGLLEDINREKKDCKISLMHTHGPAAIFCWPAMDDIHWVPFEKLNCKIEVPDTLTGRTYQIGIQNTMKIMTLLNQ